MTRSRIISVLVTGALGLASCTAGGTDKAGGIDAPVVLTMAEVAAHYRYFPAVQYFIDRVGEVSGGKLKIDVKFEWTHFAPDAEQSIVRDVAAGKADLARIGTRAFDRLGVTSLRALTAPMLIDNYPLQAAVINSEMPTKMLDGLTRLGVTGLGVLAGQLRKPVAAKPLRAPADWRGITVQTRASDGERATAQAFGATTTEIAGPNLDRALAGGEVDGLVADLDQVDQNRHDAYAPYITANVNLWPQTLALIVNTGRLAKLSAEERGWLERAARDAVAHSVEIADHDSSLVPSLCDRGARLVEASAADLAALRDALAPVYASLEQDPVTASYLDKIRHLKATTPPGRSLAVPTSCTGPAPVRPDVNADPKATSALNGTYRYTLTASDVRTFCLRRGLPLPDDMSAYPNTYTLVLHDGTWDSKESSFPGQPGSGTYAVRGTTLTWYWPSDHEDGTFTVTRDRDGTLHFTATPVQHVIPGGVFIMTAKPWIKIA